MLHSTDFYGLHLYMQPQYKWIKLALVCVICIAGAYLIVKLIQLF
jgi:hypothetical protein